MKYTKIVCAMAATLSLCGFGVYSGKMSTAIATPTTQDSKPGIADLAWIHGTWRSEGAATGGQGMGKLNADAILEERWSVPIGDSMTGAFRWIKNGKVWLFEFLTLVEQGDDIFLRWKHFGRDLVGWEEKDVSLSYRLVDLQGRKAVFESVDESEMLGPWRVIYHRTDDHSLAVRLESKESGTTPDVFRFRLTE